MEASTQFLLYKTSNNDIKVDVLIQDETLWLNQKQIGELFGVTDGSRSEKVLLI